MENIKYNPDISTKYHDIQNQRNIKYQLNNTFYNPITNIIPSKVDSTKDLILNVPNTNIDLKKLLNEVFI